MPKALIIDDNLNNALVLKQLLAIEGFDSISLSTLFNLDENLNAMRDVDIIFLDLEMPGGDGYRVLRHIRTFPNLRGAKVVAYSVHVSELDTALKSGFDGFIGKPVSAELFPQHLNQILSGEKVWHIP